MFELSGAVLVSVDGHDAAVTAHGSTITVDLPSPRGFFALARRVPARGRFRALLARLKKAGITVRVTSRGKRFPGLLLWLLTR